MIIYTTRICDYIYTNVSKFQVNIYLYNYINTINYFVSTTSVVLYTVVKWVGILVKTYTKTINMMCYNNKQERNIVHIECMNCRAF